MTGGHQTNSDGSPMRPPAPGDRSWAHPSEIGLATRGNSARRRSSILATGVLLGGLGLLLSGMVLGSTDQEDGVSAPSEPSRRIERSLVSVTVERDGRRSTATGVVLDGAGHVVVPADAVDGAGEVTVRCDGSTEVAAEPIATDDDAGVAVLRPRRALGEPVDAAAHAEASRGRVVLASATDGEPVTAEADLDEALVLDGAADPAPHLVFDRSGRFVGMVEQGSDDGDAVLLPALEVLRAARALVEAGG